MRLKRLGKESRTLGTFSTRYIRYSKAIYLYKGYGSDMKHQLAIISSFILLLLSSSMASAQSQASPELTFTTIDNVSFELSERYQQKPVLLYFWATWCPYCKKETPKIVALNKQFNDSIDVIAINVGINDSIAATRQYIENFQLTVPVVFDEHQAISNEFLVSGTPSFVIISQAGEILYRSHQYPIGIEDALSN